MANKTITQLDTAQSLNDNMYIATEVNDNTCKVSLAQIKSYCLPTGTINITQGGTYNVADYSEAVVSDAGTRLRVQNLTDTEIINGKRVWLCPSTVYLAWINQDTGSVVYTINTVNVGSNVYTWDNNTLVDTGLIVSNTDEVSYIEIQPDSEEDPMVFQVYPDLNRGTLYKIFQDKRIDFNSLTAITLENISSGAYGYVKTLIEGTGSVAPEKISKTITTNGTYSATSDDNVYGYSEVTVDVTGSGDTITATNNTGNIISNGDKVWIEKDNNNYNLVSFYEQSYSYNFDVIAETLINNDTKIVSGFSSSNYIKKSLGLDNTVSWEFGIKVRTGNDVTATQCYCTWDDGSKGFLGHLTGGVFNFYADDGSGTFNYATNVTFISNVQTNTDYWFRFSWNGTTFLAEYSTDGIDYNTGFSGNICPSTLNDLILGWRSVATQDYFRGSIDLNETYIKVNGTNYWIPTFALTPTQSLYATKIGSPTISADCVVKDFSKDNYLQLPKIFNPSVNSWEILFKIKSPSSFSTVNCLIGNYGSSYTNSPCINIDTNKHFVIYIPDSNLSYTPLISAGGSFDILENTVYWVKLYFTGTAYRLDYSTDGINYINDINVSSTSIMGVGTDGFCIGYDNYSLGSTIAWNGSIYFTDSKITINNNIFWKGTTGIQITENAQTGIAAENITPGGTGLVNVGAVIEPTGSITITTNGTHDVADYAEAVVNVPVPVVDKYKVGDRVNDDSDNPVGTVSSIFFGENNKHYAVVCLDAEYRLWGGQYSASNTQIDNIPLYSNYNMYSNTDSATKNTTAILGQLSSTGCSHCRSKSFTIGGVTYYGQLPNLNELLQICILKDVINANDPTVSSYSSQKIPTSTTDFASGSTCIWSSTQQQWNGAWGLVSNGTYSSGSLSRTTAGFIIPVLEIPLED